MFAQLLPDTLPEASGGLILFCNTTARPRRHYRGRSPRLRRLRQAQLPLKSIQNSPAGLRNSQQEGLFSLKLDGLYLNSTTPSIFIEICNQTPITSYPLIYEFFRLFK